MNLAGFPGFLSRYLSGLCVAALGLCAAGWLALAPVAFGYRHAGPHDAALTDRATGAGLAVVSLGTLVFWIVAWRRKLRADGILVRASRRQARREARAQRRRERAIGGAARTPDPAQVLGELRALLIPLLAELSNGQAPNGQEPEPVNEPEESGEHDGLAAVESMLAGAELLMVGCGEEEAW